MAGVGTLNWALFGQTAPATWASVAISANTGTSPVPWDVETYDPGNWHTSGAPPRITVPATVTFARQSINFALAANGPGGGFMNGATYRGVPDESDPGNINMFGAIVATPGGGTDYFEAIHTPTVNTSTATWMTVEKIDATLKRALVFNSTGQALTGGVSLNASWDSEVYDTDGFHDPGVNPSRLSVPVGVNLVRLIANTQVNGTVDVTGQLLKNGALFTGAFSKDTGGVTRNTSNFVSPILEVVGGTDYFELQITVATNQTLDAGDRTWFAIEEVPATVKRALCIRSANQGISANTPVAIIWDGADVYDTDSIHDPVTNNTRMTVPAGVTEARIFSNFRSPNLSATVTLEVRKNGAVVQGEGKASSSTSGSDATGFGSSWMQCAPGDYFEVWLTSTTGFTLGALGQTWACFEGR